MKDLGADIVDPCPRERGSGCSFNRPKRAGRASGITTGNMTGGPEDLKGVSNRHKESVESRKIRKSCRCGRILSAAAALFISGTIIRKTIH